MKIPAKLRLFGLLTVGGAVSCAALPNGEVIRDIRYAEPAICVGDLHLPKGWTAETPVVITIHGGGWSSGDRASFAPAADLCVRDLNYAAFNIEYRLIPVPSAHGPERVPWPACGNDCVAAAKYVLSEDFARKYGLKPKKVWLMGASAGGHLALWAGLTLPSEQVAGIVSISGIADTNVERWQDSTKGWPGVNPMDLIRKNGPRVLLTHATGDTVVTVESARRFVAAYRAAGNEAMYFEYPCDVEPGLTYHCIWNPGERRFIQLLERRIAYFMLPPRVPAPQPVKSSIEITSLYYPGTEHMAEWDMIAQTCPERKPLLGWYDEGDPEVIDWQIKWAAEHGITSLCMDWYWNKGSRRLEHWLKSFYQAHYRRHLKWFMMYANHNQPGSHSTEDQIAVTKFWIENYFKTPEYYTVDGKPAVCYWAPENLDRDFIAEAAARGEKLQPGEGVQRAFAISERIAKEAGLPGIHWIDMCRNAKYDAAYAELRKKMGFKEAIGYVVDVHCCKMAPQAMKPGDTPQRFTFDAVVAAIEGFWTDICGHKDVLPYSVLLPTGWDVRPRYFQKATYLYDRTPEKFGEICRKARRFCERTGQRRVMVSPLNEWQEGSYAEPNEEYRFGMYDAIRDAFCEKPADGWPKNLVPQDLGLGPYDFPPSFRSAVQSWNFDKSTEGWYRQPYGGGEVIAQDGALTFVVTVVKNFNVRQQVKPFAAARYDTFRIRMKVMPNPKEKLDPKAETRLRLKWGTMESPIVGKGVVVDETRSVASAPVVCDGQWREYEVDLSKNPDWKGQVDELWFEACAIMHARVAIDWMRFEKKGDVAEAFRLKDSVVVYAGAHKRVPPASVTDLTNVLTRVTGRAIPAVAEDDLKAPPAAAIYLGDTRAAARAGIDAKALRKAEFRLKAVPGACYLAANTEVATSCAMTEFVQRFTNYRFLTMTGDDPCAPEPEAAATVCDLTLKPRLYCYENSFWAKPFDATQAQRAAWFRRIRAGGWRDAIEREYRVSRQTRRCHSQFHYCPPKKYAKEHPEYYLLNRQGERQSSGPGAQLCFSNPDVFDVVYASLEGFVEADRRERPTDYPLVYDFTQEDCCTYMCKCTNCQAIVARYDRKGGFRDGGDAGLQLQFVNRLARKIRAKYPDVLIRTFAYCSTEEPPKGIVPEDNVVIWLCDLYTRSDHTRPLAHPFNARRRELIEEWCRLAKHVELWDYSLYGGNWGGDYPELFPDATAADFDLFAKSRIESVYSENHFDNQPFYELDTYVMGQLAFGTDRSADELIDEYCRVYGTGAPKMREAIDFLRATIAASPAKDAHAWHARILPWRTIATWERFAALARAAYDAADGDVRARSRIALALASADRELVTLYKAAGTDPARHAAAKGDFIRFSEESLRTGFVAGDDLKRVRKQTKRFVEGLDLVFRDLPDELKSVPAKEMFFIDDRGVDYLPRDRVVRVKDPDTESGFTLKVKPYKVFKSPTVTGGVGGSDDSKLVTFSPKFIADGTYHWYKVAHCTIPAGAYLLLGSYYFPLKDYHVVADGLDYDPNLCDIWISVKVTGDARAEDDATGVFLGRIILRKMTAE